SSAPVSTASTPGICLAALASIRLIFAWACGERRKWMWVWPGRLTSSVYWPLPVMKRKSSLRRTAAPMPVAFMAVSFLGTSLPDSPIDRSDGGRLSLAHVLVGEPATTSPEHALSHLARASACRHRLRAGRDRLQDVVVAGAAAEIAFELLADRLLVEVVALAADDVDRRHDHAGRAEAALQAVVLAERLLHRVQLVAVGEALDGAHVGAVRG